MHSTECRRARGTRMDGRMTSSDLLILSISFPTSAFQPFRVPTSACCLTLLINNSPAFTLPSPFSLYPASFHLLRDLLLSFLLFTHQRHPTDCAPPPRAATYLSENRHNSTAGGGSVCGSQRSVSDQQNLLDLGVFTHRLSYA